MGGPAALEALQDTHNFSGFDCGEPALNTWLRQRTLKNESRYSHTYVVCDNAKVVAYVSISPGSVECADAPKRCVETTRQYPRVHYWPTGRVAKARQSKIEPRSFERCTTPHRLGIANHGIAAVLIHAKDDGAKAFYLSCVESIEFPEDSLILFLPMETLVATFSHIGAFEEWAKPNEEESGYPAFPKLSLRCSTKTFPCTVCARPGNRWHLYGRAYGR